MSPVHDRGVTAEAHTTAVSKVCSVWWCFNGHLVMYMFLCSYCGL